MRFGIRQAVVFAAIGFLPSAALAARAVRQEVCEDWAFQHRTAVVEDQKTGQLRLRHERNQPAPLVDERAGILDGDRDPTDLVARRTDALLDHLAKSHADLPCWSQFRARLSPLIAEAKDGSPDLTGKNAARQKTYTAICALRREIALANPLLDFDDVLFSVEPNVGQVLQRATTGQYNCIGHGHDRNTEPGGGLYLMRGWKDNAPQLVDLCKDARVENGPYAGQQLTGGIFHAPSLSYDGKTVFFSWARLYYDAWPNSDKEAIQGPPPKEKRTADPLRLFRIDVDGTNLRQVNVDEGRHNDTEPCELPDGRICFMSTRREVYDRCIAYRPAFTLCSMKPDGSDVIELSFHETHEWLPSVSNDGMILYTRWDYVDRSVGSAHGIWTCFPDGRDPRPPNGNYFKDNIFKHDTPWAKYNPPRQRPMRQPMAVSHCHAIPGSRKVMAIGSSHHAVEIGPIIVLDLNRADDYAGGQVFSFTPGRWGGDRGGEFSAPLPLSEDFCIANCLDRIYLMDRFGNRELIARSELAHQRNRWFAFYLRYFRFNKAGTPVPNSIPAEFDDPWKSTFCYVSWRPTFPRPVRPRPRPPVIPSATFQGEDRRGSPGHKPATITVQNVYNTDVPLPEGVKIKAMRIVQVLGASSGNYTKVNGRNTSAVKIVLGTTPVEEDGSVNCMASIEKGIYFQLLDQNGLAVQSMLSLTYVHPGERLSCIGCHEPRSSGPQTDRYVPLAMQRQPTTITPETPDGKVAISEDYIVPAVDRVLLACTKLPGGPKTFDRRELKKTGWIRYSEGFGVNQGEQSFRTTPDHFGARGSKLWEFIQANRNKLKGLENDDIRLTALYLDLLCVGSSVYQNNVVQDKHGHTWPRHPDLDIDNPLGLEVVSAPSEQTRAN